MYDQGLCHADILALTVKSCSAYVQVCVSVCVYMHVKDEVKYTLTICDIVLK